MLAQRYLALENFGRVLTLAACAQPILLKREFARTIR